MQKTSELGKIFTHAQIDSSCFRTRILRLLGIMVACFASFVFAAENELISNSSPLTSSRNIQFSHIDTEDGLSQPVITSIVQDDFGFMWFGTQEGLNRYDGRKIEVYTNNQKVPSSLSNDWIWALNIDDAGVLWIGTDGGGLNRYNHQENNFTSFLNEPDNPNSLSDNRVRVVYQDQHGSHWIGTDGGGLCKFDPETGRFIRYQHDPQNADSLQNNTVLAIYEDRKGTLWIGTNGGGLASLDRSTNKFTHYQHDPAIASSLSSNQVRAIFEDRDGNLWVGTYKTGLDLFNPHTNSFRHFKHNPENLSSLSNNKIRNIYQDKEGHLWVATDGGLNEWIPEKQQFSVYQNSSTDSATLTDDRISSIFQDGGGVLWVGTQNGLNKWNYLSDSFRYYQESESESSISNNIVTAIAEYGNTDILVGTYGGGLDIISSSGSPIHYKHDASDIHSLSDNRVMAISVDKNQVAWLGTRSGGLNRLNAGTGSFTRYMHDTEDPFSLSSNGVTSIFTEGNDQIWVGTYGGGLNLGDMSTGKFSAFRHDPDNDSSISSDRVLAIFRDRNANLWVGTEDGGINRYDDETQTFVNYLHDPDDPHSLSSNAAWSILESRDGSLWIGTKDGGLNRWNAEDRQANRVKFTVYNKSNGLLSNSIQAVLEDHSGILWVSTNRGLTRLNPGNGSTRHFGHQSGLKGNDFMFAARLRSRTNRLLFGDSTAGLLAFYPGHIRTNRHQPEIALSAFSRQGLLNRSYTTQPLDSIIDLGYKEDLITFEFVALDYTSPKDNLYRYKLIGFDKEWSEPGHITRSTYTNLPAGSYNFQVQASNDAGIWNEEGATIQLDVIPPPWKTLWAYAFYVLIAIAAILMFIRAQQKKQERETLQRHELENQVRIRTSELDQRNSDLKILNKKIKESSWTDSLTGLKNRRYLQEFIEAEVALVNRRTKDASVDGNLATSLDSIPKLCFMMIDLDGFKTINDTYGHHSGDQALLHVRDILLDCCRESDVVIRWGGDEFMIVSRNSSIGAVEKLAVRLRQNLDETPCKLSSGHQTRLTGSIGFAGYPFSSLKPDLFSWDQVSVIADRAAYVAKANGRNAWVGIYCTRNSDLVDFSLIRTDLKSLLGKGQVDLKTSIKGKLNLSPPTTSGIPR